MKYYFSLVLAHFSGEAKGSQKGAAREKEITDLPGFYSLVLDFAGGIKLVCGSGNALRLEGPESLLALFAFEVQAETLCLSFGGKQQEAEQCNITIGMPELREIILRKGKLSVAPGFCRQENFFCKLEQNASMDAAAMEVGTIFAILRQGGELRLWPAEFLHATVFEKGRILFKGNPQLVSYLEGGGEIEPS